MACKELTTGEVARLLSVSEATVKRWADKRLLEAEKTAGGHRRFRASSIAPFLRAQASGAASTRVPSETRAVVSPFEPHMSAGADPSSLSIFHALVKGHADEATALLIKHYSQGLQLARIFDEILAQAMRRIGELWYRGELSVAQEHVATRTALAALYGLRDVIVAEESHNLLAICCGMEGDFHELSVQFAQVLLEKEGWRVINLGANTPFFALTEAMLQHGPILVCISSTIFNNPDRAAREYEEVRRAASSTGATIALGGAGFQDQQLRPRFPADLHADNFHQLSELATALAAKHSLKSVEDVRALSPDV